jgi:hypothetical protein
MVPQHAVCIRDGVRTTLPAEKLTIGDVVEESILRNSISAENFKDLILKYKMPPKNNICKSIYPSIITPNSG